MRDELLEVIELQSSYSPDNTPAMQRRGELIRRILRQQLELASGPLRLVLGPHAEGLRLQGRDGTGLKTLIPWIRFYSKERAPSPQKGWYCVYLFDAPGTGVYLSLGHGSTTFDGGEYKPRPAGELAKLVAWGRAILAPVVDANPSLAEPVILQGGDLGDAYERSTVLAKWYPANAMPSDAVLYSDAETFAGYLRTIYDAEVLGLAPTEDPPEVNEVIGAASGKIARAGGGQGFGLSAEERKVVEIHAMERARDHLRKLSWRVRDVSSNRPYDFECTRGVEQLMVEVKGTTSAGDEIVVTRNEVAAHRARHPNNALIIVHSINLTRVPGSPKAAGGVLLMVSPWEVKEECLRPLAFQYTLPKQH